MTDPAPFSAAARFGCCIEAGAGILAAAARAGVLEAGVAKDIGERMREAAADPQATVEGMLRPCLGLGFSVGDIRANALLLELRRGAAALGQAGGELEDALLGLAREHAASPLLLDGPDGLPRLTSLGCAALEWRQRLSHLAESRLRLEERTMALRYSSEGLVALGDRAATVTKLAAVELGLGIGGGRRLAVDFAADWALWLVRTVDVCAELIDTVGRLGVDEGMGRLARSLGEIRSGAGAGAVADLLGPGLPGGEREWEIFEQLHRLATDTFAAALLCARWDYDVDTLRSRVLGEGGVALAPAAARLLAERMAPERAQAEVEAALERSKDGGGDFLDLLCASHGSLAEEIRRLGEPALVLGPLPGWVAERASQEGEHR